MTSTASNSSKASRESSSRNKNGFLVFLGYALSAIVALQLGSLCLVPAARAQSAIMPTIQNRARFHIERAEALMEKKLFDEALTELETAYQYSFHIREQNSIILNKVIALMELERYEDAITTIDERKKVPEQENEFLFMKATCLQRTTRIAAAIALLDTLIEKEGNPRNKTYLMLREGLIFLSLDSPDRAEETFTEVLRLLESSDEQIDETERQKKKLAHYALGYIALRTGAHDKAKLHFAALAETQKHDDIGFKSKLYILLIQGFEHEQIDSLIMPEEYEGKERSEVSVLAGYLCYRLGSHQKAKEAFAAVEQDTSLDREIREMITLLSAESSYFLKAYDDAISYYQRYIEMVSSSEEKLSPLYGLMWSYYRASEYSNAYAVAKNLLTLYPDSPHLSQIEQIAALSLYYVGEHAQAKYHFSRILSIAPDLKEKDRIYYLRGKSKFYLGEYAEAYADFNTIVARYPYSRWKPHAMNMIASISFEKGEYQEAYGMYQKLLDMDLSASLLDEVRLQSERCLLHLGYYRDPIEMSKAFVNKYENSPRSPDLLLEVCEYYFQLQRYWDAIREYERFLGLFPNDGNTRFVQLKLAQSYSSIGYQEKALDINADLSKGDDEYAESALVAMGDMLFTRKQYKGSIEAFRELTKRFPESNERDYANFLIGKNYLQLNLPKEARMSLELVVKSKRIFPFKAKAHLLIAQTLYLEGKGEEYLDYLDELIASGIGEIRGEAFFLKAEYKKETGRFKKAMELYEQAALMFEELPDRVRALYEAGLAAEELMLLDNAKHFYTVALKLSRVESAKYGIEERLKRIEVIEGE